MPLAYSDKYDLEDTEESIQPLLPGGANDSPAPRKKRPYLRYLVYFTLFAVVYLTIRQQLTRFNSLPHHHWHHPPPHGDPHGGHGPPLSTSQREELFLSVPNQKSALEASRAFASQPHLAGSTQDFEDAKSVLKLFQREFNIRPRRPSHQPIFKAGSRASRKATLSLTSHHRGPFSDQPKAWIDTYYPVLNTPLNHSLEMLNEDNLPVWTAELEETAGDEDEDAKRHRLSVPVWHGLSKGGVAEGEIVYANYGLKEDYEQLVATGVNITGKIVLVRYGAIFRGLKIKFAQELGASGVLIYSDTRDDGDVTVENGYTPYPQGPARNPDSVQRGSVQFLSLYPGDPTTPGYPAYEESKRTEGTNIPSIPSLPLSWSNAQRIFEEIGSYAVNGERAVDGKFSKNKFRLVNNVDTKVTPIWNTMAAIPGHIRDEVVVVGNHRDAWVLGAADPTSGTASMNEIVRGFGELLRSGWKPLRTILFASWDAEEYGLVGSTEWGEDFPEWISAHVVAYLNVDVSVAGSRWQALASPSLAHIIKKTASDVDHPTEIGKSLWDATKDVGPFFGVDTQGKSKQAGEDEEATIGPLGSGSDYTVFLQRLGVASTDNGFGGTGSDAPYHYHSIFDSQRWQEVYADPGFHRHVAVAKYLGLLTLRMADSLILPLNTTQYSYELDSYLDKVEAIKVDGVVTTNFTSLRSAIHDLQSTSKALDEEKAEAEEKLKEILSKLPHHGRFPPPPPHPHDDLEAPITSKCGQENRVVRSAKQFIRRAFGVRLDHSRPRRNRKCMHDKLVERERMHGYMRAVASLPREFAFGQDRQEPFEDEDFEDFEDFEEMDDFHHPPPPPPPPHLPPFEFIKAVKRVAKVNKQLASFEAGFISTEGIKDREWYKHLGVAPGKNLGYGATTLPALTESLTIEKNETLAELEADRLVKLMRVLAKRLEV